MVLPSSAMRVASSSSDTTSSPRSGSPSNGGGTRRVVPTGSGIGGTLATVHRGAGLAPRRPLERETAGRAGHAAAVTHLGGPDLAPGHRQDPLDGGGVGWVGGAGPG